MKMLVLLALTGLAAVALAGMSCAPAPERYQAVAQADTPRVVPDKENFYQAGRFYFGGQPDEEMMRWFSSETVKVVINLRTDGEMEAFTEENFDEAALAGELDMTYLHFPLGGRLYSPHAVDTLAQALEKYPGRTLIHCRGGGRVNYLWIAYLVNYKGLSVDQAVALGKKMGFYFVLEDLLGYELTMRRKDR